MVQELTKTVICMIARLHKPTQHIVDMPFSHLTPHVKLVCTGVMSSVQTLFVNPLHQSWMAK